MKKSISYVLFVFLLLMCVQVFACAAPADSDGVIINYDELEPVPTSAPAPEVEDIELDLGPADISALLADESFVLDPYTYYPDGVTFIPAKSADTNSQDEDKGIDIDFDFESEDNDKEIIIADDASEIQAGDSDGEIIDYDSLEPVESSAIAPENEDIELDLGPADISALENDETFKMDPNTIYPDGVTFIPASSPDSRATYSNYNGQAAANYALNYANTPNKAYKTLESDCTNFVSQAVAAGENTFPGTLSGKPPVRTLDESNNFEYRLRKNAKVGQIWQPNSKHSIVITQVSKFNDGYNYIWYSAHSNAKKNKDIQTGVGSKAHL